MVDQKIIKRYNKLMYELGWEHKTIGESDSENGYPDIPENDKNLAWNIRDMVAEADYLLSCYNEEGHNLNEMKYSDDPEIRKTYRSDVGKLKRFIARYEPMIWDEDCIHGHCSQYD